MIELEKCRLIEQFMGWEMYPDITFEGDYFFENHVTGEQMYFIDDFIFESKDDTLPYLTDWNWLMEALRKFDYLYDDNHYVAKDFYREYCDHCDDIDATLTTHDITDTVNALCDGIEWYNSTIN